MREKEVEAYLVKRIREAGGTAYKFVSPGRTGVPDRLCVLPGTPARIFWVELKAPGRKPTAQQLLQIRQLRDLGCRVFVADTREAVDQILMFENYWQNSWEMEQ